MCRHWVCHFIVGTIASMFERSRSDISGNSQFTAAAVAERQLLVTLPNTLCCIDKILLPIKSWFPHTEVPTWDFSASNSPEHICLRAWLLLPTVKIRFVKASHLFFQKYDTMSSLFFFFKRNISNDWIAIVTSSGVHRSSHTHTGRLMLPVEVQWAWHELLWSSVSAGCNHFCSVVKIDNNGRPWTKGFTKRW